jgi:hypothetical protein
VFKLKHYPPCFANEKQTMLNKIIVMGFIITDIEMVFPQNPHHLELGLGYATKLCALKMLLNSYVNAYFALHFGSQMCNFLIS